MGGQKTLSEEQEVATARQDSAQAQSVITAGPGKRNNGPGLLSTPDQFKRVQENYLAVSKVGAKPGSKPTPSVTPQGGPLPKGSPIPTILVGQAGPRGSRDPYVVRNLEHSFAAPQNAARRPQGGSTSKKTRWS